MRTTGQTSILKPGTKPYPRRRVNPRLRQMVHASGRPMYEIATIAGFRHVAKFSSLVNASIVPDSNVNVRRLNAIADAVGLPRTEVFIDQAVR